jgi:long-chain acyl-CoA synthetase
MTVQEKVLESLRGWGGHPALIEIGPAIPDRILSADDLQKGIGETTAFLSAAGVHRGMVSAMLLGNSAEFLQVFLALCSLGSIPVFLKLEYRRMELEQIFANCEPAAVIVEAHLLESLVPYLCGQLVITRERGTFRIIQEATARRPQAELPHDIASLIYTYRGYGYPLAAMVPHAQYLQGSQSFQERTQGTPGEQLLFTLPMSHILTLVGCVLVPFLNKMTVVIARTLHPHRIFQAIEKYSIQRIIAVPEVYFYFLRLLDVSVNLSSLRVMVSGGSELNAADHLHLEKAFGAELLNGYGLTEFAPVSGHFRGKAIPGTLGPVCSPVEAHIDSPNPAQEGEILIRGPCLFRGYFRRESETREAFRDGWFATGDLGRMQGEHLVFHREKKRTCKVNGSLVDLEEVRRAVLRDPDIVDAEIEGSRNRISARIALSSQHDLREKARSLISGMRTLLADNKMPTRIERM